jgi:K+-transporting ATPase ATPase B chain
MELMMHPLWRKPMWCHEQRNTAAKEAGNMVDLDNDPHQALKSEIGKQLLMTRGTLTTFSIANDVAKYFAIVPALFITAIPALKG